MHNVSKEQIVCIGRTRSKQDDVRLNRRYAVEQGRVELHGGRGDDRHELHPHIIICLTIAEYLCYRQCIVCGEVSTGMSILGATVSQP